MQAPFTDPFPDITSPTALLPLIGREGEMQAICALLDTVVQQSPLGAHSLVISGDLGVGKTRLLTEMYLEASKRSFRILEGRTYEASSAFPFFPFIEALRPILRSTPLQSLRVYLGVDFHTQQPSGEEGDQTTHTISWSATRLVSMLARLFPELPDMLAITPVQEQLSPDQEKFQVFDAIATFLERMSIEEPVLLSIDNMQWADSASMELTLYLTVRLRNSRVALAAATRPPGTLRNSPFSPIGASASDASRSAQAMRMLSDLMRQGLLLVLPLPLLPDEAAGQHLHTLLPGEIERETMQQLLSRAEGNPFFLEELVRMLTLQGALVRQDGRWQTTRPISAELPDSLTLAVEQRLQGLSEDCLEMLRAASLFGRAFPLQALQRVLQADTTRLRTLVNEAEQSHVISSAKAGGQWSATMHHRSSASLLFPTSYLFCQGIVQEALSGQVPEFLARVLHGSIGAALEAQYGKSAQGHAPELARHYALSDRPERALRWNILAGEHASRQQAYREAIQYFTLALHLIAEQEGAAQILPTRAQLHLSLGESWFRLGELDSAANALQQALEQSQLEPATPLFSAHINRALADVYRMQGKYELALAHLQAARHAFDDGSEDRNTTESSAFKDLATPGIAGAGTLVSLKKVSTAEYVLLLQAQATLDVLLFHEKEAEKAFWQSQQLATEIADRGSQAFALHMIGWIRGWGVHIHEAIRLQEQAHALYLAIGDPFRAALGNQGLGIIYLSLGEMEQARRHNEQGLELARRYGVRYVLGWLYWNQGVMALFQGDWKGSEEHFQQAMQEAEATSNNRLKPVVLQAQAELHFRQGNWKQAEVFFLSALQASINTEWYTSCLALYGHFLAVTGRRNAAKTQLELAATQPEPGGYSGHFFIPQIAEGFLHVEAYEQASAYIERIQNLQGFMYYGLSVDRILAEVAASQSHWEEAERAFENGLALCRKIPNPPEEATILYEWARTCLMRASNQRDAPRPLYQHIHRLCGEARQIFLRYEMTRAIAQVDTLQEGLRQLEQQDQEKLPRTIKQRLHNDYQLDLRLTRRELEVLRLVAEGHTDREVAEILVISPRTANRHLSNIFVKLDVPGRAAAVAFAIRQGLVG